MPILLLVGLPFVLLYGVWQWVFGPMSDADVPRYVSITEMARGEHVSGRSPGPGEVISIAVHNSAGWRSTPTRLWAACTVSGNNPDVGDYADKIEAYEAEGVRTPDGAGGEQYVPSNSTATLDFNTQSGTPDLNHRAGEAVGMAPDACVIGATKQQALALAGYRDGGHDQQGQYLNVSRRAAHIGVRQGWNP